MANARNHRLAAWAILMLFKAYDLTSSVRVPPTIVEQLDEHEVLFRVGIEIILPCRASGIPEPQYEWYRNGDILELNDVDVTLSSYDGTLTIREAGYPHEGYYQCRAHNDHGTALSNVVYLHRGVLQTTESETATFSGRVGESLQVPCSGIHSIPKPVYSWALAQGRTDDNPLPLSLSRRVTMDENGHLYFAYLTDGDRRDGFLYICNAFNVIKDLAQAGSYSIIEVDTRDPIEEAPPKWMYSTPSPHVALIGQETRLKCFFSGRPAPHVTWGSVGKLLPVGRHTTDAFGTELVIENVQADDEGEYICWGSNSHIRSEFLFLDVQSSPSFDAGWKPENINATEGNDQSFHCKTSAEPSAHSQWMINGEPIDPSDPGPRMSVSSDGYTLTINDLCKTCPHGHTDLRVIQCNSSNVHGYAFASAYLNVLVRTQIALAPEDVVYEEGLQEVRFDCEATSDDSTPVEISWLKDNSTIYPATNARINITDSNTLVIDLTGMSEDDIRAKYHGEYRCFATNSYTSSTEVARFRVPGVGPPDSKTGADVCFRGFTLGPTGQDLHWPESPPGRSIKSAETCIWDGEPLARRSCVLRDDLPPYWGGVTFRDCLPNQTSSVTDDLQNLAEEVVTSSNATNITNELVELTSDPESLAPIDVVVTSQVLENLVNVKSLSLEVGQDVLGTVSQTLAAGEEVIAEAQRVDNSSNRMLSSMDTFAGTVDLGSLNSSILVQPKVAMGIYDVTEGMDTIGFAMMKIENDTLTEQHIQGISESTDTGDLKSAQAWIRLSPEVIELALYAKEQQRKLLDDPKSDADLKELIRTHPVRLSFQTYQDISLFQTHGQIHQADPWSRAGSKVIAATLQGYGLEAITNLSQPVNQTFHVAKQASKRHCAFWDFSAAGGQGNWSTEGCDVVTADETHITCACNHLTNFAILMDVIQEKLPPIHNQILSLISMIGLILSITGLSLTIITLIVFRDEFLTKRAEERTRTTKQVLLNLALALLLVYILFLAGIEQTHNKAACQAMSAFIYYFLLVAFAWMLVEAVLQYHQLVKIMPRLPEKFMLKAGVPAWGIPMLAVTIVAAVDSDSLITANYCWLDSYAFYFGFLVPIGCVIIVNSVLYTLVIRRLVIRRLIIRRLVIHGLTRGPMEGSAMSKQVSTSAQLWISATCFVVLGITWIFGFLAVADARLVFQYLFCIFNSIQGFLIFILHCLRNKKIQRAWLELCCCSQIRNWASSKSLRCCAKGNRRSSKNTSSQQTELSTINSSSVA